MYKKWQDGSSKTYLQWKCCSVRGTKGSNICQFPLALYRSLVYPLIFGETQWVISGGQSGKIPLHEVHEWLDARLTAVMT